MMSVEEDSEECEEEVSARSTQMLQELAQVKQMLSGAQDHGTEGISFERTWGSEPLGQALASRALHDALALQLARRGFDALRKNALGLLAELTAAYIGAIGAQLQRVAPPGQYPVPVIPLVVRLQRHTNLRSMAEWRRLQTQHARRFEPLHGAAVQVLKQKQPCLGGEPPAGIEQLYAMMRASWHYKQTPAGGAAHAQAGQSELAMHAVPSSSSASGADLSEVVLLRKAKGERRPAENWLLGVRGSGVAVPPPATGVAPVPVPKASRKRRKAEEAPAADAAGSARAHGNGGLVNEMACAPDGRFLARPQ